MGHPAPPATFGLVPVDYKSGCNSFPTVVMLYKYKGWVMVQYFGNNYLATAVLTRIFMRFSQNISI